MGHIAFTIIYLAGVLSLIMIIAFFFLVKKFKSRKVNGAVIQGIEYSRLKQLRFRTHSGYISLEIEKILFLKGNRSATKLFMEDSDQIVSITHNLIWFESILRDYDFLRIHNSWLVNIQKIDYWYRKGRLLIINDYGIPVSRRNWRKAQLILTKKKIKSIKFLSPVLKIL